MVPIRRARPEDALEVAEVHIRSWQEAYRGLIADDFLDALDADERSRRYDFAATGDEAPETLVALGGGAIVAFVTYGPSRDEDAAGEGEIYALYVDPRHWRDGVGRLLLERARDRLGERGFAEAVLWVLEGNEGAEGFYRDDGWRRDGAERLEDPYGVVVRVRRFRRRLP